MSPLSETYILSGFLNSSLPVHSDDPLVHFYNTVFLAAVQPPDRDAGDASGHREEISETTIEPDGCSINVGGVEISFRRTVRVPGECPTGK